MPSLMAIGAHADDHEMNVGGTLAKYHQAGYRTVYVMSTNNMSGNWCRRRPDGSIDYQRPPWHVIQPQRRREAAAAAARLTATPIDLDHPQRHYTRDDGSICDLRYGTDGPTQTLDRPSILTACDDKAAIDRMTDLIMVHQPEAVFTHGMPMMNMEHMGTLLLVTHAYHQAVKRGYNGWLLCWHDLNVNIFGNAYRHWDTFIDVSDYWQHKLDGIAVHASQVPDVGRLRFPDYSRDCGCKYAEVFNVIGAPDDRHSWGAAFTREIVAHAADACLAKNT